MGAERGVLVDANDDALDALVVARTLKALVDKEKPDLVVMGKQVVDGDSNTAGQMLAELLGWPMATFAMSVATTDGGKTFTVGREVDTGVLTTLMFSGPIEEKRFVDVSENAMYWYFVVLTWLPVYGVIYWAPRLT